MFIIRFWAIFLSRADLVSQSRDGLVSWIFMSSHEFLRILILNTDPNVKTAWTAAVHSQGSKDRQEIWIHHGLNLIILERLVFSSWDTIRDTKSSKGRPQQDMSLRGVRTPKFFSASHWQQTLSHGPIIFRRAAEGNYYMLRTVTGSSHSVGWVGSE